MDFRTVNQSEIKVLGRKARTSKYQPLIAAITNLQDGKVIIINCKEGQEARKLRSNLYQFLRNSQEIDLSTLQVLIAESNNAVIISGRMSKEKK